MIPADTSSFFVNPNKQALYQGDILSSESLGIKETETDPDFWIIITKSCDLAFRNGDKILSKGNASLLPLLSLSMYKELMNRNTGTPQLNIIGKIVELPLILFSKATNSIKKIEQVDNLIKDELSKFMFIPPDGEVLKEPVIVDFDLMQPFHAMTEEETKKIIDSKVLQLASPFKEKLAQRFALHYMSIGIDDDEIKHKAYKEKLKEHYKTIKTK